MKGNRRELYLLGRTDTIPSRSSVVSNACAKGERERQQPISIANKLELSHDSLRRFLSSSQSEEEKPSEAIPEIPFCSIESGMRCEACQISTIHPNCMFCRRRYRDISQMPPSPPPPAIWPTRGHSHSAGPSSPTASPSPPAD